MISLKPSHHPAWSARSAISIPLRPLYVTETIHMYQNRISRTCGLDQSGATQWTHALGPRMHIYKYIHTCGSIVHKLASVCVSARPYLDISHANLFVCFHTVLAVPRYTARAYIILYRKMRSCVFAREVHEPFVHRRKYTQRFAPVWMNALSVWWKSRLYKCIRARQYNYKHTDIQKTHVVCAVIIGYWFMNSII